MKPSLRAQLFPLRPRQSAALAWLVGRDLRCRDCDGAQVVANEYVGLSVCQGCGGTGRVAKKDRLWATGAELARHEHLVASLRGDEDVVQRLHRGYGSQACGRVLASLVAQGLAHRVFAFGAWNYQVGSAGWNLLCPTVESVRRGFACGHRVWVPVDGETHEYVGDEVCPVCGTTEPLSSAKLVAV